MATTASSSIAKEIALSDGEAEEKSATRRSAEKDSEEKGKKDEEGEERIKREMMRAMKKDDLKEVLRSFGEKQSGNYEARVTREARG